MSVLQAGAPVWQPVYIGVGSNLDDPGGHVRRAVAEISGLPAMTAARTSPVYRTTPVGPPGQPEYRNAVLGALWGASPERLLESLRELERAHGRALEHQRWGPRELDLDILVFGTLTRSDPALTLPHPELARRDFVLVPLADVAPDLWVPGMGRVRALLARCPMHSVVGIDSAVELS